MFPVFFYTATTFRVLRIFRGFPILADLCVATLENAVSQTHRLTSNPQLKGSRATELSTARRALSVVSIALVLPPQLSLDSRAFKSSGIGG